jgi:hypothetical protein
MLSETHQNFYKDQPFVWHSSDSLNVLYYKFIYLYSSIYFEKLMLFLYHLFSHNNDLNKILN